MEVRKHKVHKPAFYVALVALVLSGGFTYMINFQPDLSSRMVGAMFSQNFKLVPNKKGLANVEAINKSSDSGLGSATQAGDRFNNQMNLLSSSD